MAAFKDSMVAENTKKSTSTSVRRLQSWYHEKYGEELDFDTISKQEAPQLLKHFFLEIRQTTKENKGKEYEPGTLQNLPEWFTKKSSGLSLKKLPACCPSRKRFEEERPRKQATCSSPSRSRRDREEVVFSEKLNIQCLVQDHSSRQNTTGEADEEYCLHCLPGRQVY
ncbi:hypothetical protein OS493_038783 [Desmophyllum pertusum]|uniref:Uncharacterized protein n=1 Tax=Desmophyllum pertusum TaxID=174260 RepID=A0A9X0CND2_9CNID|nr:hypothetical protein OS493_038783 [Desmophyllum pertusum]